MKVYVMTCERYYPTLLGFAHLFNKYWGADQQVTVVGYGALNYLNAYPTRTLGSLNNLTPNPDLDWPLPSNFKFLSLGQQKDYPQQRWSASLLQMLDLIEDDYPIIFFEDYWLIKPVKRHVVETVDRYMRQQTHVLKMDLCAERLYSKGVTPFATIEGVNLLKSDPNSHYHMSLWTGLWYRPLLYDLLAPFPEWTAWDVELNGTSVLSGFGDDVLVLGTDEYPVHHTNVHRGGHGNAYLLDELAAEDRHYLRDVMKVCDSR